MTLWTSARRLLAPALLAAGLAAGQLAIVPQQAKAAEEVNIAIISFSPYAPWYIVQEKGMAEGLDIKVQIIEDITAKNAGLTSGTIQCMLNTLDSVVVARAAGVPVKVIAIPAMSYGLDEMVVDSSIQSVEDFPGRSYGADYAFLNHMWMLLTLKDAGIAFDALDHKIMLPQDSAAAFVSGAPGHRRQLQALHDPVAGTRRLPRPEDQPERPHLGARPDLGIDRLQRGLVGRKSPRRRRSC